MTEYSVRNIQLLEEALDILLKAEEVLSEPLPAIIVRDKEGKEVRRLETYERSNSSADKIAYLREAIALNKEFVKDNEIVVESSKAPSFRTYDIWAEGYQASGDHGTATLLGSIIASSFDEAVEKYIVSHPDEAHLFKKHDFGWTSWACRLFDNEKDARKNYG